MLFVSREVPSFGHEVYRIVRSTGAAGETKISSSHPLNLREDKAVGYIENEFVRLTFDLWNGLMTSFYDRRNEWEVLPEAMPMGNTVVREQDFGNFWQYNGPCKGDAFHPFTDRYPLPDPAGNLVDYSHRYLGDGEITTGKAYAQFAISHPFGTGHFATRVRIYDGIPRVDIVTRLINHDERVRYRAVMPTSIEAGTITHEIPFGAIERPEGEFPAQNWIDYSDGSKGISLLNRGLPGNNVVDGVMLLSLLKCTALKEGYAEVGGFRLGVPTDRGYEKGIDHVFEYAFLPHPGDWRHGASYRAGLEYNTPLIAVNSGSSSGTVASRTSYLEVTPRQLVLSCVRPDSRRVIIRVYEAEGVAVEDATIRTGMEVRRVEETDLAERTLGSTKPPTRGPAKLDAGGRVIRFALGPFEIRTFRLSLE